jgi:ATP-binding cassette, subfamily G (WHITE), member 2, SNQ2
MLEVIGAGNPDYNGQDWADVWENSIEYKGLMEDINKIIESRAGNTDKSNKNDDKEFAMPLSTQVVATTKRAFIAYWRTPEYALASTSQALD